MNAVKGMLLNLNAHLRLKGKVFRNHLKQTIHLKSSHRYFTQVQCQMAVSKPNKCFFCVWTGQGMPFVEIIEFGSTLWNQVNKIWFYSINSMSPRSFLVYVQYIIARNVKICI